MPELHSRRRFLRRSAAIAAGACTSLALTGDVLGSAALRLKVGIVGVDEHGLELIHVARECGTELVAYCAAHESLRQALTTAHPAAVSFDNADSMIDRASLDAVIINPCLSRGADIARCALERGLHVYSSPLGDSVVETRELGELARRSGLCTQVNLRSADGDGVRNIVEPLQSGAIGRIREVVCWSSSLNPRGFQSLGQLVLAVPMSALGLEHPATIVAAGTSSPNAALPAGLAVRYEFPQVGARPPMRVTWYDGVWAPPYESADGIDLSGCGALYLGESGQLLDDQGAGSAWLLLNGHPPRELPPLAAPAHQSLRNWLAACAGQTQSLAGLESSAILQQTILAGLIAYRVQQPLDWDGPAMRAGNCPQADALISSAIDASGSV